MLNRLCEFISANTEAAMRLILPWRLGKDSRSPSEYQAAIYSWITDGSGDAVVSAVAGSGKTTTLIEASKKIDSDGALFLAFNKSIVEELGKKLGGMSVSTIHGFARKIVIHNLRPDIDLDKFKYRAIQKGLLRRAVSSDEEASTIEKELTRLVDLVRVTLTHPTDHHAIRLLADKYSVALEGKHLDIGVRLIEPILREGRRQAESQGCVDYTDLLWLPHVANHQPPQTFRWIFVDEAQDLSEAQRAVVLRSRAPGGRILFVGDPQQAIYGFAGADGESLNNIVTATGATLLPLSVCYRCPKSHIEQARRFAPQIRPCSGAPRGELKRLSTAEAVPLMRPKDLVIARTRAPLIAVCLALKKAKVPAKIVGDTGEALLRIVDVVVDSSSSPEGFLKCLEDYLEQYRQKILKDEPEPEMKLAVLEDDVATINAVFVESSPKSSHALKKAIQNLFATEAIADVVRCSTIHKAKGLEADRVFLIASEQLPHPKATKKWQLEQERNLEYVAYTRARNYLAVCSGTL